VTRDTCPTVALTVPGLRGDFRLQVHAAADIHISRQLSENGIWEPFETELLRRSLAPGARFLDVGANLGYFTVLAAAWVGETGRVYAFEPEPRNAGLLTRNIAMNGVQNRVTACEAALSDHSGMARLYLHPDNLGDHQLHASADRESVEVQLFPGADWFAGRETALDVIKIDVQGAEHAVVQGLLPLLRASGRKLRLLLELTPRSLREAGSSGEELVDTLAGLDLPFAIVDHLEHQLVPTTSDALRTWCNNVDAWPEDAGFMNIFVGPAV
jgi:FkbM family methyltransferase